MNKKEDSTSGVAKIESKNGTIAGKRCLFLDYSSKDIVTIDA